MALLPPIFLDGVLAIGRASDTGPRWLATGFLYGSFADRTPEGADRYWTYIVTNRHVFATETMLLVRLNPKEDGPGKSYPIMLVDAAGNQLWYAHPDENVDVAVLPVNFEKLREDAMAAFFFEADKHTMTCQGMEAAGVSEGDEVFALGFPMGLVGEPRNTVIVRRGSIARVRETLRGTRRPFLCDAFVFPGNSGGPVIISPEAISVAGTKAVTQAALIGIVAGYIPYEDRAISEQTGKTRVVFEDNSGLAAAFTVDAIEETILEHRKVLTPSTTLPPPADSTNEVSEAETRSTSR